MARRATEPLTTLALEKGKHVLVEKPVAQDFRRVRELDALAKSKGTQDQGGPYLPLCSGHSVYV